MAKMYKGRIVTWTGEEQDKDVVQHFEFDDSDFWEDSKETAVFTGYDAAGNNIELWLPTELLQNLLGRSVENK